MDVTPFSKPKPPSGVHQPVSAGNLHGYSLIEVLVALVVLSIGMLGISALSLTSLKTNRDALLRTRATILASDLANRIRANSTATNYTSLMQTDVTTTNSCTQNDGTVPTSCTPDNLANDDIFLWQQALNSNEGGLPNGNGTLTVDNSTNPPTYRITIQWDQQSEFNDDGTQSVASVSLDFQ